MHTDTAITCPSPAASNVTVGSKPAPVDFYLNGRLYTDERSALDEEMYPEEALHISKFSLGYYADPQFSTAKKEKWIKHHPGEPLTLVIHVRGWWFSLLLFACCHLHPAQLLSPKHQHRDCPQTQDREGGGWELGRQEQVILAQPAASASLHPRKCSLVWGCLLWHDARDLPGEGAVTRG